MSTGERLRHLLRTLGWQIGILTCLITLMWLLEIGDWIVPGDWLDRQGVHPRQWEGIMGILWAPFIHYGFPHLIANTIPFLVLGWLVMIPKVRYFGVVTAVVILVGGAGVWLFGARNSVHAGASILIFGYLGYLLGRGYYSRQPMDIAIALVTAVMYGGVIWGVLPTRSGISWQGHLFGFIGGVLSARLLAASPHTTDDVASQITIDP